MEMEDKTARNKIDSLEKRIDRLEAKLKKKEKENDKIKKNLKLFLQRLRSQLNFNF